MVLLLRPLLSLNSATQNPLLLSGAPADPAIMHHPAVNTHLLYPAVCTKPHSAVYTDNIYPAVGTSPTMSHQVGDTDHIYPAVGIRYTMTPQESYPAVGKSFATAHPGVTLAEDTLPRSGVHIRPLTLMTVHLPPARHTPVPLAVALASVRAAVIVPGVLNTAGRSGRTIADTLITHDTTIHDWLDPTANASMPCAPPLSDSDTASRRVSTYSSLDFSYPVIPLP